MENNSRTERQKKERLGMIKKNNQGLNMEIIEYVRNDNIIVKFEDGFQKKSTYNDFVRGQIKNPNYIKPAYNSLKQKRLGEINVNNEGDKMQIIEYKDARSIVVEFLDDYHGKAHTDYKRFKTGEVRNPYKKGKYGERVGEQYVSGNNIKNKEYNIWRAILHRVFNGKTKENAYKNVEISDEWMLYENFYKWIIKQPNYNKWKEDTLQKWTIDKDILSPKNNKYYSAETCCLVPEYINKCIIDSSKKDKELPTGVYFKNNKYYYIGENGIHYCNTKEEAFRCYVIYKNNKRKEIAQKAYDNGEITQQCYEALIDDNFLFR